MLTVSKPMSVKQADQYFKADDYYLSEKGEWQGSDAEALGLVGEVERHDFQSVLTCKDPDGGEVLVHRNSPGGEQNIRGGIDLTFSAPKGVSILSLADPAIKEAHQSAVKVALEYLEKHYSHAREQVAGEREVTEHSNLTIAKFTHMVSRSSSGEFDKANDAALREIASMQTRINKGKVSPAELMEHWKAALGERGFTLEALHELSLREGALEKSEIKETAEAILRMAADIKTTGESVFTKGEIMDLAVRLSPYLADVDQVRMNEVLRQKTRAAKEVVGLIAVGKTSEALKSLSSQGNLHQISKREERLTFVVNEYLKLREKKTEVLVLAATNSDRVELNERIRDALVQGKRIKKGIEFAVREPTGMGAEQAAFAGSYKPGQKVLFLNDCGKDLKGGAEGIIVEANSRRNAITVELAGKQREIRLKENHQNLAVYNVEKRSFAPGDRVVFLRNDKALGIKNGLQGTIKHLNDRGNITVATERGIEVRFRLSDGARAASFDL